MRRQIALVVTLWLISVTGCQIQSSPSAKDLMQIEADVSAAMGLAVEPTKIDSDSNPAPSPRPDNRPKPGDRCRVCNDPPGKCGPGKTGDGNHCYTCGTCGGDGRMDERDIKRTVLQEVPTIGTTPPLIEFDPIADAEPVEEPFRSITLHTSKKLAAKWGSKWWKEVKPKLEASGWIVSLPIEYSEDELEESFFEINRDGVIERLKGEQPLEAFKWDGD